MWQDEEDEELKGMKSCRRMRRCGRRVMKNWEEEELWEDEELQADEEDEEDEEGPQQPPAPRHRGGSGSRLTPGTRSWISSPARSRAGPCRTSCGTDGQTGTDGRTGTSARGTRHPRPFMALHVLMTSLSPCPHIPPYPYGHHVPKSPMSPP